MKTKLFLFFFLCFSLVTARSFAQPSIGEAAYEVSLPDVSGKTVSLSSLKGKVVLVDFWASWCGPCRISNKKLVKLYSKYKSKGFEIYGVSIDEESADWKKAIAKDKISWLQVNDNGGWYGKVTRQWNVEAIPTSFLIDKEGNVAMVDPEGKELENAIKKLLQE